MLDLTIEIEELMKKRTKGGDGKPVLTADNVLSTGNTLLNLALTDKPDAGYVKGKYFWFVGDSSSGKTWLCLTCLAEAVRSPAFKNYRLIYDNGEDGALMDMKKYFGSKMVKRLEPPALDEEGNPAFSSTIEDFYYNIDDALDYAKENDAPFLYVLDSENSLTSEAEGDKFKEQKKAARSGKQAAGSYGDGKAKKHSANLRRILTPLSETGSILIIISQTRDNINPMSFASKITSGGRALKFYACAEIWAAVKRPITKTVKGKKRQLGIEATLRIKKNRITGKTDRTVTMPLYHAFGVDDLGACIDYLLEENHWKKRAATIAAPEFEFKGTREALIKHIEANNLEGDLTLIVGEVWEEIETALANTVKRKPRYD